MVGIVEDGVFASDPAPPPPPAAAVVERELSKSPDANAVILWKW
jgi:hypothetical protein